MRITADRKLFLVAFETAASFVSPRSPSEILKGVKLKIGDEATLDATDMEHGVSVRVLGAEIERPGSCILPVAEVKDILKNSTDEQLVIEVAGSNISIRGENAEFDFPGEDPDKFPELPQFPADGYHVCTAADFRKLVDRSTFAAATEAMQGYTLQGCVIEVGDGSVEMAGTDGGMMAMMRCAAEDGGDTSSLNKRPLVMARSLAKFAKHVNVDDPPVQFRADEHYLMLRTGQLSIYSRLVAGRFPQYQHALSQNFEEAFRVKASDFRSAVESAAIMTEIDSKAVQFQFASGRVELRGRGKDKGKSVVRMAIPYEGKDFTVLVDPKLVASAMAAVRDAEVAVSLTHYRNGLEFKTDDGFQVAIAPIDRG